MGKLDLMTFNLRYHEVKDGDNAWPHRVSKVAKVIDHHHPVVIGTQEGLYPMLVDLSAQLPAYDWIGEGRMGGQEDEHNAIFYMKHELNLLDHGQFWLSEQPDKAGSRSWDSSLPRICTWAVFETKKPPVRQFAFYNTHLDHVGQTAREHGIALIWSTIRRRHYGNLPVVLTGDLNSGEHNRVISFLRGQLKLDGERCGLKDAYAKLPGNIGRTAHSFEGGSDGTPIDYIFVSDPFEVTETKVIRERTNGGYPSDHYPVTAKLDW